MNRIRQLIWAIKSKYEPIDDQFIRKYLNDKELTVFNKLNMVEKHHSIRVSKDALYYIKQNSKLEIDKNKMVKISLMHDIGKIYKSLNVFEKCLVVILDKITLSKISRFKNIKMIDVYYNHPEKSCEILKKIGKYDKEFLEAISKHHSKNICNNIYLEILKQMDDQN